MCGICGEIRFDGRSASIEAVSVMNDRLAPRGPDGAGVFQHGRVALGHRRLKIIDTSDRAHQPMVDPELGLALVYNGAIYNYPELRAELEGLGYRFFSHGDTEVILKGYHAWGLKVVERLAGMFAFAILERDSGRVALGRDRLGIKPLYLAEIEGGLRFASNLTALTAAGGIDAELDPQALHHYLSFHAVVPAPRTILKGVRKLPPATVAMIEPDGSRRDTLYWDLSFGPQAGDEERNNRDWEDLLLQSLRQAVRRRLVADVPVGVLLSGGLDSSLVVGLLAEEGQHGLATFSVGFEAVGDEAGDEFRYSDLIAQTYATDHHKIFVSPDETLTALPDAIAAMSEPQVSHDAVGFYLLSRKVSEHVKVVQSGQGADEVFGGYHWYPPMQGSSDPVTDYARAFFDRDQEGMAGLLRPEWLSDDVSRAFVHGHFTRPGANDPVDKALRLDTQVMLVEDPVKRVDNMTMRWGLEARVPFLDHELVELAARIPAPLKLADGGKGILKAVGRRVIPSEVIDRPKGYFPVPALKYLRGPFLDYVRDLLNSVSARQRGLFQTATVQRWLDEPEAYITPLRGSMLWQIALLEGWLATHNL